MSKTTVKSEKGQLNILITREFDAPRMRVFKAFVDRELFPKWLGPRKYDMILDTFEPKNGGSWRYIQQDKEGHKFAFHGVYHEVIAPELLIDTFEYEGLPEPGHVSFETARFSELPDNRTLLTINTVFQSVDDRNDMLKAGMEGGMSESFARLDELLENSK